MTSMSVDEVSERLIVGLESFLSLGISFLSTVTGTHISPLSTPAICHLYGLDVQTTEFFLETSITPEDDVCVASDWIVLALQFLLCLAVSWWSRWLLWVPIGRSFFLLNSTTTLEKFSSTLSQNVVHLVMGVFAWRILLDKEWILNPSEWSLGRDDPTVAPDLKFFYLLYAAKYASEVVTLYFEHLRSHSWAYAVHHALSVALVLGLATSGYIRIGCVLMFFLDWVDPFMLTAKLFRYLSVNRNDGYQYVASRLLELFGVTFVLTRYVLSTYVVWIIWKDVHESAWHLKAGCLLLVALQTFWLLTIVRTVLYQLTNRGQVEDIRSDSEDEKESKPKVIDRKERQ